MGLPFPKNPSNPSSPQPGEHDPQDKALCDHFLKMVRHLVDPADGGALRVTVVDAVFPVDSRGLVEVLCRSGGEGPRFINGRSQPRSHRPLTLFLRDGVLAYVEAGW
jgi:hypothetical protein